MSKAVVFVQAHGHPGVLEAELAIAATLGELHDVLERLGVKVDAETFIFVDEANEHACGERHEPVHGIKHGTLIHVGRCKRIKTSVNFGARSIEREFAPGTKVRAVKEWAVSELHMAPKDAAEHVLQICNSTERPASNTPLHLLTHGKGCPVCFDLVPEKRVEG